jgi:transposase
MSKFAAARLFGVSLSSVKRYARLAERGESLTPRKGGGRPPKANETTTKLLKDGVEKCPIATTTERCRFLRSATGKSLSTSTVRRLLKRLGFKNECGAMERDEWLRVAWRAIVAEKVGPEQLVFVDEMGANTALSVISAW